MAIQKEGTKRGKVGGKWKKSIGISAVAFLCTAGQVWAASPLPSFDKEAVQEYDRHSTTETIQKDEIESLLKSGNLGTKEVPAFYIKGIRLTGKPLVDEDGRLTEILSRYSHRTMTLQSLNALASELTEYCRSIGYTVPKAVVPPQELKNQILEVHIYAASYDEVTIHNTSDVADSVIARFTKPLHSGELMKDEVLEKVINNLNDLPGVKAQAILRPGTKPETTSVDIEVQRRPVWNSYLFVDNGGGYYSGRYRYGANFELNNPTHQGDRFVINGMITSEDVDNYSARYETAIGGNGTRLGVAYSKSSYEMSTNTMFNSLGESEGLSIYGITPLYRSRSSQMTLLYGYDQRNIEDKIQFILGAGTVPDIVTNKKADVFHVGINGSKYRPNQITQYNFTYWNGHIDTDGGAYYDGLYHKLTGDILQVWYAGAYNYRMHLSGQLANRGLDGSEQFYLGGMNGVRAYGSSDGYGDYGYLASAEIRRQTGIEGLEIATFIDVGEVRDKIAGMGETLAGWGVGLRYTKENDWYMQLDYARKIDGRPDSGEPKDHNGRLWFQVYKMI